LAIVLVFETSTYQMIFKNKLNVRRRADFLIWISGCGRPQRRI